MHPISSKDEGWFTVFNWRGEPSFHKNLKWSYCFAIGMWEGHCVFCLKWNGPWEALTQKNAGFLCSYLNSGSSFISQDEGMSESRVDTVEKTVGLRLIWTGGITSFDISRGTWNLMLQKVTMPDSFWKWIGIPISLFQLESEPRSPASLPKASILSWQA